MRIWKVLVDICAINKLKAVYAANNWKQFSNLTLGNGLLLETKFNLALPERKKQNKKQENYNDTLVNASLKVNRNYRKFSRKKN